ncbi:hypothetical protein FWP33_07445 [Vibrio parahaemolyticus]|nr:hypothetical protein [Vibrio parahaemolyticus]EJO2025640.1 hypothetical protein [Vibrio parahaemolyticus]
MKIKIENVSASGQTKSILVVKTQEVIDLIECLTEYKLTEKQTELVTGIVVQLRNRQRDFTMVNLIAEFDAIEELESLSCMIQNTLGIGPNYRSLFKKGQINEIDH